MDQAVFAIAALACLVGALGVIVSSNPVHSALSLVGTLFGIAILFVELGAHFLAAVQVIVYAGAIVVLFLFVIMLLGVDRAEALDAEPLGGQRPAAAAVAVVSVGLITLLGIRAAEVTHGAAEGSGRLDGGASNVVSIGRALFTDYVFAFEITSVLLVVAVVGAVVLARRADRDDVEAP
jgi:NADH-quinone oxidoreductase subunit J